MKALADYVHTKGLKLGIYSSPGPKTCAEYEGSLWPRGAGCADLCRMGHRLSEVRSVRPARSNEGRQSPEARSKIMVDAYKKMHDALRSTGRPIVYSLCQYG